MEVLFDRSESIHASVTDVKRTLLITLVLVVLVIFLFLRNLSATVIPSLALPMSIVGTFIVLYLLGFSLDNLSLMALTLSVGFVVDDAIVDAREHRPPHGARRETAARPPSAARARSASPILSMTLSLAAVFIPILFMGGILGRLFHEFAITITAAILISGFVSLSLTPMLASRFLRPSAQAHHGRFYAVSERVFDGMLDDLRSAGCAGRSATGASRMLYSVVDPGAHLRPLRAHPEGVPAERGHRAAHRQHRGRRRDLVRRPWWSTSRRPPRSLAADPNVDAFMSSAGGARVGAHQPGHSSSSG